jgi:hypothetical protein
LKKTNTLLFVHDSLPAEGISGMIVFLRHFTKLKDWEIHILIPESAYQKEVVDSYPLHFKVHTFPIRLFWWPSFREDIPIMVKIRVWALNNLFKKYIHQIKPHQLITVQYHYYSVAIAQLAKQIKLPLITFLHDRWDITSLNPYIQGVRTHYARQTLEKSSTILAVTEDLIKHYLVHVPSNAEVFYPIPSDIPMNTVNTLNQKHLIYAGTIENHHFNLFELILPILAEKNWRFTVISNRLEGFTSLLDKFQCFKLVKAFETNYEALNYMQSHASAVLVNYGLTIADNPFASHSFPSKFVEYCHLGKPILTIAPQNTPFYKFLKSNNWLGFLDPFSTNSFKKLLENLDDKDFYSQNTQQTNKLSQSIFNTVKIQGNFENFLVKK